MRQQQRVSNEPRGNAYGRRGVWPGEFRGWRDPEKQARKLTKQLAKQARYNDAVANYYPQYRTYNVDNNYYDQPARETFVRSLIANLFAPQQMPYTTYVPAYTAYTPAQYPVYRSAAYDNSPYYYSNASYSPAYQPYYDPYAGGYNSYPGAYYQQQQPLFGGGGLKSSLLNIGLSLLQGFLGQGYEEGLMQGQLARSVYGNGAAQYYDPYVAAEPAYYSPYASSLADERQIFDEGYRLGYEDALRQQGAYYPQPSRVDLVTEFLANTLLSQA
jgi:hypothetical protein